LDWRRWSGTIQNIDYTLKIVRCCCLCGHPSPMHIVPEIC
jgi:hypothetical protein